MFMLRVSNTLSSFLIAVCERGPGRLVLTEGLEGSLGKTWAEAEANARTSGRRALRWARRAPERAEASIVTVERGVLFMGVE